jgi:uncharacterized protein (TIGR03067 family)
LAKPRVVLAHKRNIRSLAFSPDRSRLAAACLDGTISVWDATNWRQLWNVQAHNGIASSVVFSGNGKGLLSAGGPWDFSKPNAEYDSPGEVLIWDVDPPTARSKLVGHTKSPLRVVISPADDLIASAGGDNTVRLWPTPDYAARRMEMENLQGAWRWMETRSGGETFKPKENEVLTHIEDNRICWDHGSERYCVAFEIDPRQSPPGFTIAFKQFLGDDKVAGHYRLTHGRLTMTFRALIDSQGREIPNPWFKGEVEVDFERVAEGDS